MAKDYYLILGVSRNADQEEIKSAYRRAVKDYHPDVAKSPDKEKFIEIQEAYETLKDPEKKKVYDKSLKRWAPKVRPSVRDFHVRGSRRLSDLFSSIFDDLFDDITSMISHPFSYRRVRTLTGEIILSSEEAASGGYLPLSIPVVKHCPYCDGKGREELFRCPKCFGEGIVTTQIQIEVKIPPNVTTGTILEIPFKQGGIMYAHIKLKVIVA